MPSPIRFSPVSTVKSSRLSSSAMLRASLIGSLSGASASGYFALPITSANRSAATAADGTIGANENAKRASNERRIVILLPFSRFPKSVQVLSARPELARDDSFISRKSHYQTARLSRVSTGDGPANRRAYNTQHERRQPRSGSGCGGPA